MLDKLKFVVVVGVGFGVIFISSVVAFSVFVV